ncbi:hypothetical protein SD71_17830 [Cohnella kolymensis]|uniref:Uncharacterized protein n=1 Tax=Cohnella kolymensis TaxID=1590652 RepID=A0ABR5A1D1_9BACL|nr:hypothetical protein [Cohnella kolymensis]KIL34861.1 hypothetical protein SD71_17830 [Cohnella kolymensis]
MKLGTFVWGGLAGAAVVMLLQRNNRMSAITSGVGQNMSKGIGGMTDNVIEKALNMKFTGGSANSSNNGRNKSKSSRSPSHTEDLEDVKKLASKDPSVAHEVNSILEQNGEQRHQI